MHDNVAEWSQDWYVAFAKSGLRSDPEGPGMGRERVVRGDDWLVGHEVHRSASRLPEDPSNVGLYHGFRVVMVGDLSPAEAGPSGVAP
jgi:formylglycine-generating enzyme required for sulfatase activity